MTKEHVFTKEEHEALRLLHDNGFAVAAFTPEELRGAIVIQADGRAGGYEVILQDFNEEGYDTEVSFNISTAYVERLLDLFEGWKS